MGADASARARPRCGPAGPAPTITVGFEVLVHEVMAAIATDPWPTSADRPPASMVLAAIPTVSGRPSGSCRAGRPAPPGPAAAAAPPPTARPCPGRARAWRRTQGPSPGSRHRPWVFGVALDQVHALRRAPGEAQVGERLVVDREQRRRRPELRAHVGDRGPVGERQAGQPVARELHERADHAERAQHLGDRRARGRSPSAALGSSPVRRTPTTRGIGWYSGWPEQDGLRLDAAHAVAQHAQPVDHRGVRVGADEGVGIGDPAVVVGAVGDDGREVLEVDLVDDPRARGHDAQVAERGLRPAQQLVALAVALVLALDVEGERAGPAPGVDLDRVVDDEVGRDERIDRARDRRPAPPSRRASRPGRRPPARR